MKTTILNTLSAVQSVSPIGTLAIFTAAFIASYIGLGALLIVAALLAGMHFAKRPAVERTSLVIASTPEDRIPTPFEQLTSAGLECSKVEFKKPAQPRASKKTA